MVQRNDLIADVGNKRGYFRSQTNHFYFPSFVAVNVQKTKKEHKCVYHRIISWFGLEGFLKTIQFHHPPGTGMNNSPQTMLPKAPFSLALSTSILGSSTASLGNLFQYLANLIIKHFFLIFYLNMLFRQFKTIIHCSTATHLIFFVATKIAGVCTISEGPQL